MDERGQITEEGAHTHVPISRPKLQLNPFNSPDNGSRVPEQHPAIRTRLRNPHIPLTPKPRPLDLASPIPTPTHPSIPPRAHNLPRLPPHLLLPRLRLRRHHPKDLGLGARRAGTHRKRAHQSSAILRLRRPARRHSARLLLAGPNDQTMGPVRLLQKHPHTPRPRPLRQRSPLHPLRRSRLPRLRQPLSLRLPR